ncbi:hypothetical protein DAPPUDRAFT_324127 [Daphnia pulex]|uniref:Single domain-containing protein n=1 Tax=Daphnia pulex TaxID=6669 RepID=E9H0S8_DAPPU|nr:hypothetical protein DAPPUDRAFT_324127 [Daphnia pulex]|eukprot:EFX74652.1 hypothetical protein DAPPUDRAFT_324127 [Daphnia pulex]
MKFSSAIVVLMISITILSSNAQIVSSQLATPQDVVAQPTPMNGCFWSGTSPFCFGQCGNFYNTISVHKRGDGKTCLTGTKKLCCPRTDLLTS